VKTITLFSYFCCSLPAADSVIYYSVNS